MIKEFKGSGFPYCRYSKSSDSGSFF